MLLSGGTRIILPEVKVEEYLISNILRVICVLNFSKQDAYISSVEDEVSSDHVGSWVLEGQNHLNAEVCCPEGTSPCPLLQGGFLFHQSGFVRLPEESIVNRVLSSTVAGLWAENLDN